MARDLVLDVIAKKNSKALSELADEFDRTANKTDDFGKKLEKNATFSKLLEEQITQTKVQVKSLGEEFERTGNKDVFAKLRGAQGNLKQLESIGKALETTVEDGIQSGIVSGVKSMGAAFNSLPPEAQAAIAIGIAAAIVVGAPLIGAAAGAAILAGVGAVGIGGAIAVQLRNPAISAAMSNVGHGLMADLNQATASFGPPLIRAANEFGSTFHDKILPGLESGLGRLAPTVDKLGRGLSGLLVNAEPGFLRALEVAEPVLNQLAADLPGLGHAFSEMFSSIASGGPGAVMVIHDILIFIEATAMAVGKLIEGLSTTFAVLQGLIPFRDSVGGLGTVFGMFADNANRSGQAAADTKPKFDDLTGSAGDLTTAIRNASDQFDILFNRNMSVEETSNKLALGLLELKKHLDAHSRSLSDNSVEGLKNQEVITALIRDAENSRKALIDQAGGADASRESINAANDAYSVAIDKIIAMGVKAGLSKKELTALARNYLVDITYTTTYKERGTPPRTGLYEDIPTGRIGGMMADGGPVMAGVPYIVGEHRPELFIPSENGTIIPNLPAEHSGSSGMFGGGGKLDITLRGEGPAIDALMRLLATEIRGNYGGDVQVALGGHA